MTSAIFTTTLHQMVIFGLILGLGFLAGKLGVIRQSTMPELSRLIVNILLPALVFTSIYGDISRDMIMENLPLLGLSACFYAIIIAVTFVLSRALRLKGDRARVFQLCFIFGNTGFVGFPLMTAVFPGTGMICMTFFTLVDQFIFWTYGIYLSTAQEDGEFANKESHIGHDEKTHRHLFDWKSLVSPNTVTLVVAFAFVVVGIPLPSVVCDALQAVASATSALCMMYLGALICFTDCMKVLKRADIYVGMAFKMVLVPIALGFALQMMGLFREEIIQCFIMITALPTMTLVPIVASNNGHEGAYAAGVTAVTLVASIVTIPFVMMVI